MNSGLPPDGLVIHPNDYQKFRLSKDDNGQYFGGGPFAGQYGMGGVPLEPPLWAQRTVVTPAIAEGTVLTGAFRQAATAYRKGGVRVEAATQHASDFTSNLVTAATPCDRRSRKSRTSIPSNAQTRILIVALCETSSTRPDS